MCDKAATLGMRVNSKKMQLLCISATRTSEDSSFIDTDDSTSLVSGATLKMLSFLFGPCPSVSAHVENIIRKFNARAWTVGNLKKLGPPACDLLKIYFSLVRPVIEYAAPAYHSQLTADQSEMLERLHKLTLKVIYGWNYSYETILRLSLIHI